MNYSISDLEQLSGVQVHTIRIWERRYNALEPMRSAGNTRMYNDDHLKRLLNIVSISQTGLKISQVCALSEKEMNDFLKKEIERTISNDAHFEYYTSQLLKYGLIYNESEFDQLINKCILENGMITTYQQVIYPLLVRLGLMWRKDDICPAQEHFLSNIIRQKLYAAINDLPAVTEVKSSWLLFLPEAEGHDIGLLFANYILKQAGQKVIYLGGRVPLDSVKNAMQNKQIKHMLLFMVRSQPLESANGYLNELSTTYPEVRIHLAGNGKLIHELKMGKNINWFRSINEFEQTIKSVSNAN
ncbi:MerR family transcriptional regulator [Pedobacter sp. UYP1]|uniref:MerR family transcriptional regulator n=1 Tax=Pedobacter sp. UYP1 TaxID=1756396 RepID=UPI00339114C1